MQTILAPSKTMTTERGFPSGLQLRTPYFINEAEKIATAVKTVDDIAGLMQVSDTIARQVRDMYESWNNQTEPALFAYIGDVYRWFYANTLSVQDIQWADKHIFIMSGLYGAVRPLEWVSPYRMEMKSRLSVDGSKDLYAYWGTKIADYIDRQPDAVICNLSSDEYGKVVTKYTIKRVVAPLFMDKKSNGTIGTVPIYSKMMRGVMARWIIDNRIDDPKLLKQFVIQGYRYDDAKSMPDRPAFYREKPSPIRF